MSPHAPAAPPTAPGAVPTRAANRRPDAVPRTTASRATIARKSAVRAATPGAVPRTTAARAAVPRTAATAATPGAAPASLITVVAHGPTPSAPSAAGPTTTNRSEAA
ncbi:hypothetical protein ACFUIZ_23245 [Streptomyces cinereoruber]|uniref:hypothetical protein n=1 Tax=Streptomyces cinereoruber TaxID=67260 RepID=UPI003630DBF8